MARRATAGIGRRTIGRDTRIGNYPLSRRQGFYKGLRLAQILLVGCVGTADIGLLMNAYILDHEQAMV